MTQPPVRSRFRPGRGSPALLRPPWRPARDAAPGPAPALSASPVSALKGLCPSSRAPPVLTRATLRRPSQYRGGRHGDTWGELRVKGGEERCTLRGPHRGAQSDQRWDSHGVDDHEGSSRWDSRSDLVPKRCDGDAAWRRQGHSNREYGGVSAIEWGEVSWWYYSPQPHRGASSWPWRSKRRVSRAPTCGVRRCGANPPIMMSEPRPQGRRP